MKTVRNLGGRRGWVGALATMGVLLAFPCSVDADDDLSGERWLYVLGAVPQDRVGLFHVGGAFLLSVSGRPGWRILVGVEADYSYGHGTKWEHDEETRELRVTANDAPFAFFSTGFLLGAGHTKSGLSAVFDIGNAFWQSKLENWGGYPTYLGLAVKWQPRERIALRIADVRWYFKDLGRGNTITCYGTCTQSGLGTDSTGLGTRFAAGVEVRW